MIISENIKSCIDPDEICHNPKGERCDFEFEGRCIRPSGQCIPKSVLRRIELQKAARK